jgi:tRNA threonylcarbamoyladenosine biosynthesis protein TsaE
MNISKSKSPSEAGTAAFSFLSQSVEETLNLGRILGEILEPGMTVGLIGPLGAGKTIFVKGMARGLGIKDLVTSPTFILINEYEGRLPFYHIDAYRLKSAQELTCGLGADEIFYGPGVAAVEWADHIKEALPEEHLSINFTIQDKDKRNILITPRGSRFRRLLQDVTAKLTS